MTPVDDAAIAAHYGHPGLTETISRALAAAGLDRGTPALEALAPVDEFHTAGHLTTVRALEMMPLEPDMNVLDVGSGLGGTARWIAQSHGCRVTGLDLTPAYVELSARLTERTQLAAACRFEVGSATAMPFQTASFDAALTFHAAMNIADRPALYAEVARVLRPGAPFCVFDVMKGPTPGMRYPVPWAETEAISFLRSRDETVDLLERAGFTITAEDNLREFAIGYFEKVFAEIAAAGGPPPLGLHLLTGANAGEKFANYLEAVRDHQIEPVILVAALR